MLYYNIETYEQVDIPESLLATWAETNNPKAAGYLPVPEKPAENAVWGQGAWLIPPPVIPESVTARQIRLWLVQHGYSLATVEAAIEAIPDPLQRDIVRIEWEYAPYVERSHPMVMPIAAGLGMTAEDVDQAFIEGNQL